MSLDFNRMKRMRLYKLLVLVVCFIPFRGWGQYVKNYVPRSTAERELVRIENEWSDAAIHRDAKTT